MLVTLAGVLTIYLVQGFVGALIGALPAAALGFLLVGIGLALAPIDLGLTLPRPRFWIAAALIGITVWLLDYQIVAWLDPPKLNGSLDRVVARDPLWATMLVLAILPAFAEEMLFRGVLLRSLAQRPGRRWIAIGGSAIVFSTYHLDPPQIIGTVLIGIALGILATGARSTVPGMLAHFLNNAVVLVLARVRPEPIVTLLDDHPTGVLVGCVVGFSAGIALCVRPA